MTYYEDLSTYSYLPDQPEMLNVGWLDRSHEFATGSTPGEVVDELLRLAEDPKNTLRGLHDCHFCDVESPIRLPLPGTNRSVALGTGEIHVASVDGTVFAVPSLVVHYIMAHRYCPPDSFIDAVRHMARSRDER